MVNCPQGVLHSTDPAQPAEFAGAVTWAAERANKSTIAIEDRDGLECVLGDEDLTAWPPLDVKYRAEGPGAIQLPRLNDGLDRPFPGGCALGVDRRRSGGDETGKKQRSDLSFPIDHHSFPVGAAPGLAPAR